MDLNTLENIYLGGNNNSASSSIVNAENTSKTTNITCSMNNSNDNSTIKLLSQIYENPAATYKFKYPRWYSKRDNENVVVYGIIPEGIPDGVSLDANYAIIKDIENEKLKRLIIYSEQKLTENFLREMDNVFGEEKMPLWRLTGKSHAYIYNKIINFNFYTTLQINEDNFSVITPVIEFRNFFFRHKVATVFVNRKADTVYKLCLPKRVASIMIYMPDYFYSYSFDNKRGFFKMRNDLIIQVFSRYPLTSQSNIVISSNDNILVTNYKSELRNEILEIFTAFGIVNIDFSSPFRIIGYDKYVKLIVGSLDNLYL